MYPGDEMDDKFADLNYEVAQRLEIQQMFDWLVQKGLMGHDPETGEYWRLASAEEIKRALAERG